MDYSQFLLLKEELSLILVIVILFVADLFMSPDAHKNDGKPVLNTMLPVALLTIHTLITIVPGPVADAFGGMYHNQPIQSIVKSILSIGTLIVFLMAHEWMRRPDTAIKQGEFYILTLSTLLGMYFMISAGHFLMFFIGLETASIPMAALVAFDKYRHHSAEAGAKYILTALFSSGLLLYGLSLPTYRHASPATRCRLWHSYSSSPAWDSKYHWCLSIFGQQTFTKVLQAR